MYNYHRVQDGIIDFLILSRRRYDISITKEIPMEELLGRALQRHPYRPCTLLVIILGPT